MSIHRIPALVDVHVHMREPGSTHKESYDTGTAAALSGGVTTVLDMPNTIPPTSDGLALEAKCSLARRGIRCGLGLFLGGTSSNAQQVARLALHNSRETDVWIRYGGEEMVGLLPITDEPGSKVVGERLRRAILAHDWSQTAAGLSVTASIGLAERLPNEPVSEWLDRADRAMYAAKHGGRNRVVLASTLKS